jgi:osmotically inducible protein OsmC
MNGAVYTARARVTGGRADGHGRTPDGALDVALRMPKELGGPGGGVDPEQLFAVGYAACFGTTLGLVAGAQGLRADDAAVDARVSLLPAGEGRMRLGVALDVTLPSVGDPARAAGAVRAAHGMCPYSRALDGNVEVAVTANGEPVL